MPRLEKLKFWWEVLKGLALAAAAAFSFLANQTSQKARDEVLQARADAKFAAEQLAQQRQLDIRAYELVEKALSETPARRRGHGIAAAAIVNALTRPPLRDGLHNALRTGIADPDLARMLDAARQFDIEEDSLGMPDTKPPAKTSTLPDRSQWSIPNLLVSDAKAQSQSSGLRGYRVDLFYCEASNSAAITAARKARAEAAKQKLDKSGVGVTARVRLLPVLVQARPGYQSYLDEIRFNDEGNEREGASQLAALIGIKSEFVRQIEFKTPNYISVFYCAGAR